ncbi:MAG: 30S ribosomal protein S17 [Candidatus Komeilibacteria bacterium]|nr:30S ribosomal protein S17 [Candidatus Komeilibacteria bacterium]
MPSAAKKIIRKLTGTVVSVAMNKTAIVRVDRQLTNKKYGKKYKVSKRYKCHDEHNECKLGEVAELMACRPISKDKRWRIASKIK